MIKRRLVTIIVYIALTILAGLFVVPVVLVFANSFMDGFEVVNRYTHSVGPGNFHHAIGRIHYVRYSFIPDYVTFGQYSSLFFDSPMYLSRFWNSVALALPVVLGQVLISAPAAYAFEMSRFKHKEKLYFVYMVIMLLPLQVTLVPNFILADWLGLLETRASVILPAALNPFGVFIMRQYLRGMPHDYIDAALVDGASHLRIIFAIVMPMFKPALAALVILTFVTNWNIVEQAIIFLTSTQEPLSVYLAHMAERNMDLVFAASFFYLLPPVLMFLYWKEHMVEGIALTGIR
jgi:multiple sugar transport system permease protein